MRGGGRASSARIGLVLAALAAAVGWRCPAAAQWDIEPQLALLVNYNSNLLLTPSNAQASEGTTVSADAIFKRVTDSTEVDLHPHLELQRFFSDAALDADNGSVQGAYSAQSERSSINLSGSYEKISTLSTELSDTGIVDSSTRRETTTAAATLGHDFSELQHVDLQGSYTEVIYPGGERLGLVGYRYPTLALTDTFATSLLTSLAASLEADQLQAPVTGYEAHDESLKLTVLHKFSVRTRVTATGGATETSVAGYRQHGYVWDLHGTHNSELTQLDFDYSQSLQPSGRGYLVRRDAASLTLAQSVAPQLYATLTVQDIHNNNLSNGVFLDVPKYLTADAGFDWHVSEHLVLSLTAGVAEISEPVTLQQVRGWHTALNGRWNPRPLSVSR